MSNPELTNEPELTDNVSSRQEDGTPNPFWFRETTLLRFSDRGHSRTDLIVVENNEQLGKEGEGHLHAKDGELVQLSQFAVESLL